MTLSAGARPRQSAPVGRPPQRRPGRCPSHRSRMTKVTPPSPAPRRAASPAIRLARPRGRPVRQYGFVRQSCRCSIRMLLTQAWVVCGCCAARVEINGRGAARRQVEIIVVAIVIAIAVVVHGVSFPGKQSPVQHCGRGRYATSWCHHASLRLPGALLGAAATQPCVNRTKPLRCNGRIPKPATKPARHHARPAVPRPGSRVSLPWGEDRPCSVRPVLCAIAGTRKPVPVIAVCR